MKSTQYDQHESDFPSGLSAPARRALAGAGYTQIEQLTEVSESEFSQLHGIGPNAIRRLRLALGAKGLQFAKGTKKKGEAHRPGKILPLVDF